MTPESLHDLDPRNTPCVLHKCPAYGDCEEQRLACNAWFLYVTTGTVRNPRLFALPTREVFVMAERDDERPMGERRSAAYKTMIVGTPEMWAEYGGAA